MCSWRHEQGKNRTLLLLLYLLIRRVVVGYEIKCPTVQYWPCHDVSSTSQRAPDRNLRATRRCRKKNLRRHCRKRAEGGNVSPRSPNFVAAGRRMLRRKKRCGTWLRGHRPRIGSPRGHGHGKEIKEVFGSRYVINPYKLC